MIVMAEQPPMPKITVKSALNLAVIGGIVSLVVGGPAGILCFFLDILRKVLKLSWRLAIFGLVFQLVISKVMGKLGKMAFRIMMAGGPIKAFQSFFFGGLANIFGSLGSFFAGRGALNRLGNFFGALARGCDDRCPSAGLGQMDNGFMDAFSGGGNPFGGGGGNPLEALGAMGGGAGGDPFGVAGNAFDGDGGLFGGGSLTADPFGVSNPFADGPPPPPSPPPPPFEPAPGVKISVRKPGGAPAPAPKAAPMPPPPSAGGAPPPSVDKGWGGMGAPPRKGADGEDGQGDD